MPARLLVASLGNPAPYANTFHSAGHTLIESLRVYLDYPRFNRDNIISPGLVSRGDQYTLYQSPSYMNTSGPAIAKAFKAFVRDLPEIERSDAKLVVLHDELESPLGKIKLKLEGSARGHRGIKSCLEAFGGRDFARIGVGIGRPESRETKDVANFVLRKMSSQESNRITAGSLHVAAILENLGNR